MLFFHKYFVVVAAQNKMFSSSFLPEYCDYFTVEL